jgi:hypothetical protein
VLPPELAERQLVIADNPDVQAEGIEVVTFEQWMRHVDGLLLKVWGVTSGDIADRLWRDAYEDGVSPTEMARDIVSEGIDAL